jgi:hypothetical protein
LVGVTTVGGEWPSGAAGEVRLQGLTDNLGNTFAVTKLMSSKLPLVVILAELSAQLRARKMALSVGWTPRDQNEEADALTNGDYAQLGAANRVNVTIEDVQWLVLPKMMAVASDIFVEVQRRKASRDRSPVKAPPAKRAKGGGLRQRDPW